jgi:regulator of protease activity HflC (stomatin/prohibitin superfamily)
MDQVSNPEGEGKMSALLFTVGFLAILGISLWKFLIQPIRHKEPMGLKPWFASVLGGIFLIAMSGTFFYAEPGHSYLVQYPWGTQNGVLTPGYHFDWYGTVLDFNKVVTIHLTDQVEGQSETATADDNSVLVRFNDAVKAKVSSSTRFRMPEDEEQFKKIAIDYRSMSNLVHNSLVPVTKEVIRNAARELSAQDYVTGQGGLFENNVLDQLERGIVVLKIEDVRVPIVRTKTPKTDLPVPASALPNEPEDDDSDVLPEDPDALLAKGFEPIAQPDADRGVDTESRVYQRVARMRNPDGTLKRKINPIVQYNILVTQSTIERVLPEKKFQEMLGKQRDAAARAAVARQEAKQAEYERQKVLQQGETEKARTKMEREQEQVDKVISAETAKKEAEVALQTADIKKNRAEIDAKAVIIKAKADADARRMKMVADGALNQKLAAWKEINAVWAEALANQQLVPNVVIGGNNGKGSPSAADFMSIMTAATAQQLGANTQINKR